MRILVHRATRLKHKEQVQGTCLVRSSRFLTMDYSYIMINILKNEFDFEIANLF